MNKLPAPNRKHRDQNYFFNGLIDDVSIYNRVLSSLDVIALANGIKSDFYGGSFGNALDFDGVKDYVQNYLQAHFG